MTSIIPYLASFVGVICYGTATVLEQVGAKQEKNIKSINPMHLIGLVKQSYYLIGLVLDVVGWIFFLVAVRSLPLFLVQSFVAMAIVVSALLDRFWLKNPINKGEKLAIVLVVIGVSMLSFVAKPSAAIGTTETFKNILIISPIIIAIFGGVLVKLKSSRLNSIIIAGLAGLAFGGTSVVTRIISFNEIGRQLNQGLLLLSLAVYGVLALIFLSIVLQREKVNRVNSVVLATEVIGPSLIGIAFLGDSVRNGLWLIMIVGLIMVFFGALMTSSDTSKSEKVSSH